MRTKSSNIWRYFHEINKEKAKCKLCDKEYSRKDRTTSRLLLHFKAQHNDIFLKLNKDKSTIPDEATQLLQATPKQLTIKDSIEKKYSWPSTHEQSKKIDRLIAEMLALEDLPFNFVEAVGFKRVLQCAVPRYHLRGRDYFTKFICEDLYGQMAKKVTNFLNSFEMMSFTTDIWSEPSAGVSLLSLTAHAVSKDMKRNSIILKCEPIEGSHTSALIFHKLELMLIEWGIKDKLRCIVHDRGANMVRAMNIAGFDHINCAVHQLQLCVKEGLKVDDTVVKIIEKTKRIVGHFNHSVLAQDRLKEIQELKLGKSYLGVIQDCPTRWNSTFYMLKRLLQIKESVVLYLADYNKINMTHDEWKIIKEIVSILQPFEEVTTDLSGENVTVSSVIPLTHAFSKSLLVKNEEVFFF